MSSKTVLSRFVSAYQINTVLFSVLYQHNTQYHIGIPNTFSVLRATIFKKYILVMNSCSKMTNQFFFLLLVVYHEISTFFTDFFRETGVQRESSSNNISKAFKQDFEVTAFFSKLMQKVRRLLDDNRCTKKPQYRVISRKK